MIVNSEYSLEQLQQAEQVANALIKVSASKRSIFALVIESMVIGAEMAEQNLIAPSGGAAFKANCERK